MCWRNLESTPVVSVSQELVALMQSSVVAASAGCIRNAVALRDLCALTLSSGAHDALGLLGLLMKEKFQRLRLETKSLKLSQNSATLGTCSLQEVAASWLRSHAANVHGASSANCFPFSPTAICPFWPEVRCTRHVWGVSWSVGSAMSGQRMKLAQTPFSQSLASRT